MIEVDRNIGEPTLVVGYRRDPSAERALIVAIDMGRRLRAQLRVIHVVELIDYPVDPDSADWEEQCAHVLNEQRSWVERTLAGSGLDWDYEIRRGNAAIELARAAHEYDALFIVVGSRGAGLGAAISRLERPSVSHQAIGCQTRPVLVVPPPRLPGFHPRSGRGRSATQLTAR
jgi:nucleotide-binding universal stress UspA family protein